MSKIQIYFLLFSLLTFGPLSAQFYIAELPGIRFIVNQKGDTIYRNSEIRTNNFKIYKCDSQGNIQNSKIDGSRYYLLEYNKFKFIYDTVRSSLDSKCYYYMVLREYKSKTKILRITGFKMPYHKRKFMSITMVNNCTNFACIMAIGVYKRETALSVIQL